MHPRNKLLRILKFLGKALLGFIALLLVLLLVIHTPAIQNNIARRLSAFLASNVGTRVEIQSLKFSIFGNLDVKGLEVWDSGNTKVISVRELKVTTDIFDLISGDYLFDEIYLEGFEGHLLQNEEGLNIQFILDAFQADTTKVIKVKPIELHFNKITLEHIAFEFISTVDSMTIDADMAKFESHDLAYALGANRIEAGQTSIDKIIVNILSSQVRDEGNQPIASATEKLFNPDFGLGIGLDIEELTIRDSDFSFHTTQVIKTPKFDPAHIDLRDIQLNASGIFVEEDSLVADINKITAQMPGFIINDAGASVVMSRHRLDIEDLYLTSGDNGLQADISAWYDVKPASDDGIPGVEINAKARLNPDDIEWFLSEEVMQYLHDWKLTELVLAGKYDMGKGELTNLELKTANSELHAVGIVRDIWDAEMFSWEDLEVEATIGSDFKRTITPFLGDVKVPPAIMLRINSSGNQKKLSIDGKLNTTWGNVEAKGVVAPRTGSMTMDMKLAGKNVRPGQFLDLPWLGPVDLSIDVKGKVGDHQDVEIKGLINSMVLMDQRVNNIAFDSRVLHDSAIATIMIKDPRYQAQAQTHISFAGPMLVNADVQLDEFELGTLLNMDSTLALTGNVKTKMNLTEDSIMGYVEGDSFAIRNQYTEYLMDSLIVDIMISPEASNVDYFMDGDTGKVVANFDLRELPGVLQHRINNLIYSAKDVHEVTGSRTLQFDMQLSNAGPFQLMGIEIDSFSGLNIKGGLDEQKQSLSINATSGKFKGYGVSLDTIYVDLKGLDGVIESNMHIENLLYNTYQLGNLDFDMVSKGDTAVTNVLLAQDSFSLFGLHARILPTDSAVIIYPDNLVTLGRDYVMDQHNRVYIKKGNVVWDHFQVSRDDMHLNLNGDLSAFEADFSNLDLTILNTLLFPDSTVIDHGSLTGKATYIRGEQINLNAHIDSLILYQSVPLTIALTATSEDNQVPFHFLLSNETNKVDVEGKYFLDSEQVDAVVQLDVNNLEMFSFLVSGILDDMAGKVKGDASITGPLTKPDIKGSMRFMDVDVTTSNPKLKFHIDDDILTLENSKLSLDNFMLYDQRHHPLTITGFVATDHFETFTYDLKINTERFTLMDRPASSTEQLKGLLEIGTDITLKGNDKDTYVDADITIMDTTYMIYEYASAEDDLLKIEGIVEFVDPGAVLDSALLEQPISFYDSLVSTLPEFTLNATLTIEDGARLKMITNAQSGDFFEASGKAKLELNYDRIGNAHISGDYTINDGVYRVSFYDLVKRNFQMVPGSSISWSGTPETGELDVKAVHTVASNSIGLVGHEVGENEKAIYKRSLDYEVSINVSGTIDRPVVSFALDLPQVDRTNYPVLANKLDRLKLPEFQSELNKQVFGLLVLGGFLPESTGADINSNQIATTALYNSVNSLLASQLNRFAGQHIKGVTIDVGIQSYADYSTPDGKTQTAMDFRVSKSILNDRLSFEVGGDFDISSDQSGGNTGDNYRGDVAIIYDLTGNGDKQLKLFNNETYDIIYQEIRNTGISLIFIREFDKGEKVKRKNK